MAGRKPIASAVHLAAGTYKHDPGRENKHEPKPVEGAPNKPAHIAADFNASQYWDHAIRQLADMNILTKADRSVIEMYAEGMAFRKDAGICKDFKTWNSATITCLKIVAEIGMSPSSRSRLVAKDPVEEDAFSQWQKGFVNSDN